MFFEIKFNKNFDIKVDKKNSSKLKIYHLFERIFLPEDDKSNYTQILLAQAYIQKLRRGRYFLMVIMVTPRQSCNDSFANKPTDPQKLVLLPKFWNAVTDLANE